MASSRLYIVATKLRQAEILLHRICGGTEKCKLGDSALWKIVTKYYEVEVEIQTKIFMEESGQELRDIECEALILMIDANLSDSFSKMKDWFQNYYMKKKSPISLLVLDMDCINGSYEWEKEARDWSIEHGFECIQVSMTNSDSEAALIGDDQGVPRVKAALEAHMWPGYSPNKPPFTLPPFPHEQEEEEELDEDGFDKLLSEMSTARDRLQRLPDEERREAAANLALRLAQYFGDEEL